MTAPYTPATLHTIQQLAPGATLSDIARQLGWDVSFLQSIVKRHQIEIAAPPASPVHEVIKTEHDLDWTPRTGEARRRGHVVTLPGRQAQAFAALLAHVRSSPGGAFLSSGELIARMGYAGEPGALKGLLTRMRDRLSLLGVSVGSQRGPQGGYRLEFDG